MWTTNTNDGFNNNIAGIIRDDNSLVQKQSNSTSDGNQLLVTIGNTFAATNAANTGTFSANLQSFTWGDNNVLSTPLTSFSAGSATVNLSGGNVHLASRRWRAKNLNIVSGVTVQAPLALVGTLTPSACSRYALVTASDASYTSNIKIFELNYSAGVLTTKDFSPPPAIFISHTLQPIIWSPAP